MEDVVNVTDNVENARYLSISYLNNSDIILRVNTSGLDTYQVKLYDLYGHQINLPEPGSQDNFDTYLLNRYHLPHLSIILFKSDQGIERFKLLGK